MRIPPVVLWLAAAGAQRALPGRAPSSGALSLAAPLAGAAVYLGTAALLEFAHHDTTVDPVRVHLAGKVVRSGPYALTRNPMYVGIAGTLAAHAVARRSPAALLPVIALTAWLDRVQIPAEESHLAGLPGYAAYRARVPRWL